MSRQALIISTLFLILVAAGLFLIFGTDLFSRDDISHMSDGTDTSGNNSTLESTTVHTELQMTTTDNIEKEDLAVLSISQTPNRQKLDALGVEWDPHFWRSFNTDKGVGESDWDLIKSRAKKLGVQKIRIMVLPGFYEPENDNDDPFSTDMSSFDFDNENFNSLYRQLLVAEELGIRVNLTIWGADYATTPWLAFPNVNDWLTAPNDPDEYSENICSLLEYLIFEKNLSCVKELTVHNEPDWAFKGADGSVNFSYYAEVCKNLDARLKAEGLRDKVKLILSDDTFNERWLKSSLSELHDVADGFNSHCYLFGNENLYLSIYSWAKRLNNLVDAAAPDAVYTHNEFGGNKLMGAYKQLDIDEYFRGVYYARITSAFLNAGSAGMLHWVFFDQYYYGGSRQDALMEIGLFRYKDEGWAVRPLYHAWGLLMNYLRPGSDIYEIISDNPFICGTALQNESGKWTYVAVNSSADIPAKIRIDNPNIRVKTELNIHLYSKDTVTESDEMIKSAGTLVSENGSAFIELPANSFIVLTELSDRE